ncbi:serine/threonine-protein kinase 32A-like isoform X2 [Xenia sp. Carnegie-2017]|nr:serine/threonine-protein kinase 32A-like isoform X2 [Xenia sp. Carnegie-2017]
MYAMKYMRKAVCIEKDAVRNVLREMDILMGLDNSFLVNLWFTFQDEEDLFVVVDLLLGGDLRYHLQQGNKFSEDVVILYVIEISLALEYLRKNRIIHRDIKPDNLLLDSKGHVHLTDFNVATVMEDDNTLATSMSGTIPYMAPEIFRTSVCQSRGYTHEVDWWSLGVTAFELLKGKRPYHITAGTNTAEIIQMFDSSCVILPNNWSKNFKDLVKKLLHIDPDMRLNNVEKLKECELMDAVKFEAVKNKDVPVSFIPSKDHLNCDPTYELEEMIIEPNPLHKKKKRLAKQCSNKIDSSKAELTPMQKKLKTLSDDFKPYNREREKILLQSQELNNIDGEIVAEEKDANSTDDDVCHRENDKTMEKQLTSDSEMAMEKAENVHEWRTMSSKTRKGKRKTRKKKTNKKYQKSLTTMVIVLQVINKN